MKEQAFSDKVSNASICCLQPCRQQTWSSFTETRKLRALQRSTPVAIADQLQLQLVSMLQLPTQKP